MLLMIRAESMLCWCEMDDLKRLVLGGQVQSTEIDKEIGLECWIRQVVRNKKIPDKDKDKYMKHSSNVEHSHSTFARSQGGSRLTLFVLRNIRKKQSTQHKLLFPFCSNNTGALNNRHFQQVCCFHPCACLFTSRPSLTSSEIFSITRLEILMSSTSSASSRKAPMSLVNSIAHLRTAMIKKLTDSDKTAPLFIETCVEDEDAEEIEDVVELACGHILCKKNIKVMDTGFRLISNNGLFANLSIFEATWCPICKSDLLANKDAGSKRGMDMSLDGERGLCGLERQSTAEEQSQQERENGKGLEPSADERLDMSLGETLIEACRRAKRVLTAKGAGSSKVDFGGA